MNAIIRDETAFGRIETGNPISEIPRESFCKAYIEFTTITCDLRSGQRYCGLCL